jgi:predicted DNA binding protein
VVVIVDITVSADAFALGRVLDEHPEVEIELERIVPLHDTIIPLFWLSGGETEAIEETLRENRYTNAVSELTTADGRTLVEVQWSSEINGIIEALVESNAKILEATGTAEAWEFRLRFLTHEELRRFNQIATDGGVSVTLRHMYNPRTPDDRSTLSPEQEEAVRMATERGYFQVPRRVTASELAAEIGISDSAFSQRLRRGLSTILVDRLAGGIHHA